MAKAKKRQLTDAEIIAWWDSMPPVEIHPLFRERLEKKRLSRKRKREKERKQRDKKLKDYKKARGEV